MWGKIGVGVLGSMPSLKKDNAVRVAYLGPRGTFSEQAARRFFADVNADYMWLPSIEDVFRAVDHGEADCGIVPVENSIEGSVNLTLDLLYETDLRICGEIKERVIHNLIVSRGVRRADVRTVLSHQQALAQCRNYLKRKFPQAKTRDVTSKAAAVKAVRRLKRAAAIGTELAANVGGMRILARDIADNPNNFTRFLVLSRTGVGPTGNDKTFLIFSTKDRPGALYEALKVFAIRGLNLCKIESRPARERPWEYNFYTAAVGHIAEVKCRAAVRSLEAICRFVKVLGSYPIAK